MWCYFVAGTSALTIIVNLGGKLETHNTSHVQSMSLLETIADVVNGEGLRKELTICITTAAHSICGHMTTTNCQRFLTAERFKL